MSTIQAELDTLRAALSAKYPTYLKGLAKPISAAARKKALGAKLAPDLALLWGFADGADGFFVSRECDGMDWISVVDAESTLEELAEVGVGFPKQLVPFATDGAGNYLAADEQGNVFDWDHEERKAKRLKPNVAALVKAVATAAKSGKFLGGPEVVAKPNAQMTKAKKMIEADAAGNAFKVHRIARKLEPAQALDLMTALAASRGVEPRVRGWLAEAQAAAGKFDDAILSAKKSDYADNACFSVGEAALGAKDFAAAEKAFSSIKKPDMFAFGGIAAARKKQKKDFSEALTRLRARLDADAKRPVDWKDASSCYEQVSLELGRAMVAALAGHAAESQKVIAAAKERLRDVQRKDVRQECLQQLKKPTDYYGGVVVVHCEVT